MATFNITAGQPASLFVRRSGNFGGSPFSGIRLSGNSGPLPAGLSIDSNAGRIVGTPTQVGSFFIVINSFNDNGGIDNGHTINVGTGGSPYIPPISDYSVQYDSDFSIMLPQASDDTPNDTLTYSITEALASGISFDSDTRILSGRVSSLVSYPLTYVATDSEGNRDSETFDLIITNTRPITLNQSDISAVRHFVTGAISFEALSAGTLNGNTAVDYRVRGLPSGLSFDSDTRIISGTISSASTYSVTYEVEDAIGHVVSNEIELTVEDAVAPTLPGQFDRTFVQNVSFFFPLLEASAAGTGSIASYTVSGLPAGVTFDSSTLIVSGALSSLGSHTVTYTATNSFGAATSTTFTLTGTSPAPSLPSLNNLTHGHNVPFTFTLPVATDPDSSAASLVYSIKEALPSGVSFNAATRVLSGTHVGAGTHTLTYRVADSDGYTDSDTFDLVFTNTAPTLPLVSRVDINKGEPFSLQLPAGVDGNNEVLTYSIANLPAGLSFNASTRTISGIPTQAGDSDVVYTATDTQGASASQTFVISVNTIPTLPEIQDYYFSIGSTVSITLPTGSDEDLSDSDLTYSFSGAVPGLTYNMATRTLSGTTTMAGTNTLTYSISDGEATFTRSFTVSVSSSVTGGGTSARSASRSSLTEEEKELIGIRSNSTKVLKKI